MSDVISGGLLGHLDPLLLALGLNRQINGAQPAAFDNEICSHPTCNLKYKIWRLSWHIVTQNKRKARKSVNTMHNNLEMFDILLNLQAQVNDIYQIKPILNSLRLGLRIYRT